MSNLAKKMKKMASVSSDQLKALCVQKVLDDNHVELNDMTVDDVLDYFYLVGEELTFDNLTGLVEKWIKDSKQNYPEYFK